MFVYKTFRNRCITVTMIKIQISVCGIVLYLILYPTQENHIPDNEVIYT